MNFSTAIMLLNPNVKAILATYEEGEFVEKTMFKTFDSSLAVGDLVVVQTETRHKATVVKVTDINAEVNFKSSTHVNWVIGRYDPKPLEALIMYEKKMEGQIRQAEKKKETDELAAMLKANAPGIENLQIASITSADQLIEGTAEKVA